MEDTLQQEVDNRMLSVNITLDHGQKKFTYAFEGEWRGRDVKYVMNHIFREYRGYMKGVRDKAKTPEPVPAPPVTGATEDAPKRRRRKQTEDTNATRSS